MEICREYGSPFRVVGDLVTSDESQPVIRGEDRRQHHKRGRRENTSDPSSIEPRYGNTLGSRLFVQQKVSDQESGDDEKDVDTDKSSGKRSMEAVIEQHQPHSNGTHTLDIRPKSVADCGPTLNIVGYGGRCRPRCSVSVNWLCVRIHTAPSV